MTNRNLKDFCFPFLISLWNLIFCKALKQLDEGKTLSWPVTLGAQTAGWRALLELKWLSAKTKIALKEFLLSHVFYSERSMFFSSSVGMTFILAGYLTTLDGDTLTSVGHWPKSWGAPWTNRLFYKPGSWEGWYIFDNQTFQHNVFLSGHPPCPINVIVKNIKCVLFYFRIINGLCLPTSQWQRRNTVQNCRKINMWKLSMEKKTNKNSWVSCRLLLKL